MASSFTCVLDVVKSFAKCKPSSPYFSTAITCNDEEQVIPVIFLGLSAQPYDYKLFTHLATTKQHYFLNVPISRAELIYLFQSP
jgi:hypothetical protein